MPKIRHLAIKTKNPAKLAEFYAQVFDMKVVHSERSGAVYMSDGYLTLALLRNRGEATPSGINHFGFQGDNPGEAEKNLAQWAAGAPADSGGGPPERHQSFRLPGAQPGGGREKSCERGRADGGAAGDPP